MKILWDNYLEDATVTATSEDDLFPIENLTDIFLELRYQAEANQTELTIEFEENKTVSMIAFGYHNIDNSSGENVITNTYGASTILTNTYGADDVYTNTLAGGYELFDSEGNTVGTGQLNVEDDVSITYPDSVECRTVVLLLTASETLYVGGMSIGDPMEYANVLANPEMGDLLRDDVDKTNGGQNYGEQLPMLRSWSVAVPDPSMTNAKRLATREMLESVGSYQPVYADLWEETDDEPAMYCNFTSIDNYVRNPYTRTYSFGFTLEECR